MSIVLVNRADDHVALIGVVIDLQAAILDGDEGSIAVCDLCGDSSDHRHDPDEYGFTRNEDDDDDR